MRVAKVLDGNQDAAKLLAEAVHQTITMDTNSKLKENQSEVCIDDFGIWIDPIGQPSYVVNINIFWLVLYVSNSRLFVLAFVSYSMFLIYYWIC